MVPVNASPDSCSTGDRSDRSAIVFSSSFDAEWSQPSVGGATSNSVTRNTRGKPGSQKFGSCAKQRSETGSAKDPPPADYDQHGDVGHQPGPEPYGRRSFRTGRRSQARRAGYVPRQRIRLRHPLSPAPATLDARKVSSAVVPNNHKRAR